MLIRISVIHRGSFSENFEMVKLDRDTYLYRLFIVYFLYKKDLPFVKFAILEGGSILHARVKYLQNN